MLCFALLPLASPHRHRVPPLSQDAEGQAPEKPAWMNKLRSRPSGELSAKGGAGAAAAAGGGPDVPQQDAEGQAPEKPAWMKTRGGRGRGVVAPGGPSVPEPSQPEKPAWMTKLTSRQSTDSEAQQQQPQQEGPPQPRPAAQGPPAQLLRSARGQGRCLGVVLCAVV